MLACAGGVVLECVVCVAAGGGGVRLVRGTLTPGACCVVLAGVGCILPGRAGIVARVGVVGRDVGVVVGRDVVVGRAAGVVGRDGAAGVVGRGCGRGAALGGGGGVYFLSSARPI